MVSLRKKLGSASGLSQSKSSAFRVDAQGNVLDQSPSAEPLVKLWEADTGPLHQTVDDALSSGLPTDARIEDKGSTYWLVAVPQGDECVIVTRDTTLPDKVTDALLKSRTMLKALLDASVDVAFELNERQRFRFITPPEAFGQQTELWLGQNASRIFWPDGDAPVRNPFAARHEAQFENVAIQFAGDERRWLHFTVHPQLDAEGRQVGLRGTCRDMSERFLAARKTKQDGLKFMLLQRITGILNTAESAEDLFDSASAALQEVLRADMVWAAMHYAEGLVPSSIVGTYHEILDMDTIWAKLIAADQAVMPFESGSGRQHLALRMQRGDTVLGMMIVGRDTSVSPWSELEIELLSGVVDVLTAAFGKAELIETLYRLSSKDELTGLMNRRAITEAVERRLQHQSRTGLSGCLIFIDLDHFKEINDTLGHKAGDTALKKVAERMEAMIRPCDFAGRYGGDEFILWLEDMTAEDAAKKAQALIQAMPDVRSEIGATDLKLGASIGICPSVAGRDQTFEQLAEKADAVLYDVKEAGRGDVAIAQRKEVSGEDLTAKKGADEYAG
ncbi:MAG: diguanylate cyclase [Alphaproteobacteria bacterium]|nr:diguanylate cyclase [Alphaproteobacteria bacterium]